ncbi:MAG: UDP-glucose/GDP-mannose dehydrogenase family protein [Verrucomicrobia bacterium]|nr:MAG: UDP-glucose/GDP-mannose dehydrogenase family protein [Verrucomicrobiota bacterium]
MNVVVLGLWHLGCVTAACCAEYFAVVGLDFDRELVANLIRGKLPVFEPGLPELMARQLENRRLSFSSDADQTLKTADVLWVCYDTPVDRNDVADNDFVLRSLDRCVPELRAGATILISSQLPVGTCRRLQKKYASRNLSFACSPENLRLGNALESFRRPDRIVAGVREEAARSRLRELFAPFTGDRVLWMTPESAEMTKHAINTFLALSVTFANEIARLCEVIGADAREVEQGLRSERRIGANAYIRPGAAFAGGTLARDVVTLKHMAHANKQEAILIEAILSSNEVHKQWALHRVETAFPQLDQVTVAILGLTYKPGTDTLRRSSALELCLALLSRNCTVCCYDPAVKALPPIAAAATLFQSLPEAVANADAIIVATPWPQITQANWDQLIPRMKEGTIILDANRALALSENLLRHVRYVTVGAPQI